MFGKKLKKKIDCKRPSRTKQMTTKYSNLNMQITMQPDKVSPC